MSLYFGREVNSLNYFLRNSSCSNGVFSNNQGFLTTPTVSFLENNWDVLFCWPVISKIHVHLEEPFFDAKTITYIHIFFFSEFNQIRPLSQWLIIYEIRNSAPTGEPPRASLSNNKISSSTPEALDFLGNSSLKRLELSSNQIKEVR